MSSTTERADERPGRYPPATAPPDQDEPSPTPWWRYARAPLVALLPAVSHRRVLGWLGRWNQANAPWVKGSLAAAVILMGLGLLVTL